MTVEEVTEGGVAVFRLSGELDLHDAPALRQRLLARATGQRPNAVVNVTNLSYIDSAGLGVLVAALKAYTRLGGRLALAGPRPEVRHILEITRLIQQFPVHESETDALGALGDTPGR
jgi:anti-sigma B factor antagonist